MVLAFGATAACTVVFPIDDGFDRVASASDAAPAEAGTDASFTIDVIAQGEWDPNGIVVDEGAVYWQTLGEPVDGGRRNGEVVRFDRASGAQRRTLAASIRLGHGLVADDQNLYWVEGELGTGFGLVRKDGFGRGHVERGYYPLRAVAVDATNAYVIGAFGELTRGPIDDGPVTELRGNDLEIESLVVDAEWVYLTSRARILRASKVEAGVSSVFAVSPGDPVALAMDGTTLFWATDPAGKILRLDRASPGGTPVELASGQANPAGIAVGGDYVYWTNVGDGTVRRVPREGGTVSTIASGQKRPTAIAAAADLVAWTSSGDGAVTVLRWGQPAQ